MIFVLGGAGVYLLMRNDRFSKWGAVLCLMSEPFWFYSTLADKSWGIFAVSFVYTFFYVFGIYNFWFRNKKRLRK
jgi:drug/metabolite transporter (DMT)-like permease